MQWGSITPFSSENAWEAARSTWALPFTPDLPEPDLTLHSPSLLPSWGRESKKDLEWGGQFPLPASNYKWQDTTGLSPPAQGLVPSRLPANIERSQRELSSGRLSLGTLSPMAGGREISGSIIGIILKYPLFASSTRILSQEPQEKCNYIFCLGTIIFHFIFFK